MFGIGIMEALILLVILFLPVLIVVAVVRRAKSSSAGVNVAAEIERLHALKQKGALTDAEFDERKRRLLAP